MSTFHYAGNELAVFAAAANWKRYLAHQIRPFVRGRVLEVGAGLGSTTKALFNPAATRWVCLEPDAALAARLGREIESGTLPPRCEVVVGTLADFEGAGFDCILYIDVLEHIDDDRGELARAATRAEAGGHVVVLSPARPWLFSPFDRAIGHYRRYTKAMLRGLTPAGLRLVRLRYLDAVGMLASAANRTLLHSSMPTSGQVRIWDGAMVPLSRIVDPLTGYALGKSVLAVWQSPRDAREDGHARSPHAPAAATSTSPAPDSNSLRRR